MTHPSATTLLFIDARVANYQALAQSAKPGTEVVIVEPTLDGVKQITRTLAVYSNLASVQIISHGDEGRVQLGNTVLSSETLPQYQAQLQQWGAALSESG
ncbi:MAG: DUF4347 domain-containing protein, partial [Elainellaceae cyanobacterium]